MRIVSTVILVLAAGLAGAGNAAAGQSDLVRMFGRDPGTAAAHACFQRKYTGAHLASHPDQNVTAMLAYVSKQEGDDTYYGVSLQVNFRKMNKPFQIAGSCSQNEAGQLACGIDCDGGSLSVRVKNAQSILIDIPESVRMFDPAASDETADLPQGARFGADDKLFRLDRTALADCLPVIFDDEIRAKVSSGAITQ
jgi:hypothetical protein